MYTCTLHLINTRIHFILIKVIKRVICFFLVCFFVHGPGKMTCLHCYKDGYISNRLWTLHHVELLYTKHRVITRTIKGDWHGNKLESQTVWNASRYKLCTSCIWRTINETGFLSSLRHYPEGKWLKLDTDCSVIDFG